MGMDTEPRELEFAGVLLSAERVAGLEGGRAVRPVHREQITELELRFGFLAAHPLLQIGLGVVLSVVGVFQIDAFIGWCREGGTILADAAYLVLMLPLGAWWVAAAARRGYFLAVRSHVGNDRFPLKGVVDRAAVYRFAERAHAEMGYDVLVDIERAPA